LRDNRLVTTFFLSLMLIFLSSRTFAHKLLYENSNSKSRVATAVYLDEESGQIVVKKYSWDADFERSRTSKVQIKFPQNVKSFSSMYSSLSEDYAGLRSSQKFINLNQRSKDLKKELSRTVDDKSSKFSSSSTVDLIAKQILKTSPYKVIAHRKKGFNHNIFLLNSVTGEFYMKSGRKTDLNLGSSIAFPKDLDRRLYQSDSDKYDLSSPSKIKNNLSRIKSSLKKSGLDLREVNIALNQIHDLRREQQKKIEKMKVIRSIKDGDETTELLFNFETGEFYYRRIEDGKVQDDQFFDINNDKNLGDLKEKLRRADLYDEGEFNDTFQETFIRHCAGSSSLDDLLPNIDGKIEDILKVNDAIWDQYLRNSLAKKPVVLNDGSMVLGINALGRDHNVQIELDALGNIKNLKFLNEDSATSGGVEIVKVIENGKALFKIISSETNEDLFFFDMENKSVITKPNTANLAVYVKGKKGMSKVSRNMFDKNVFQLEFSGEKFNSVGSRIQLSSERESPYVSDIKKGDSSGFTSFVFSNFFSLSSKRNKISKEIKAAIKQQKSTINKDGKILLKDNEIHSTVLQIVSDVEAEYPKLDANVSKLTAKTYEHSYKRFISIIVPRMINDLMPGEADQFYKDIAKKSMNGLNDCLLRASKKSNTEASTKCVDTYMVEAPVLIGEELLKFQLESNNQSILTGNAVLEYNKCIKEFYDKSKELDFVKGCLYRATLQSIDNKLEDVVGLTLKAMEKEYETQGKDVSFKLSTASIDLARKSLRGCYKKKGFIKPTVFSDKYQLEKLNPLETEKFKQEIFSCVSEIEAVVGRDVSATLVSNELKEMAIDTDVKKQIKQSVLVSGYDKCVNAQKKKIAILEKSGIWQKIDVQKCANFVTVVATSKVIDEMLKDKLGSEQWDKLLVSDKSPHHGCFKELENLSLKNSLKEKPSKLDLEGESTKCLKQGIVWASYYLGVQELEKTFQSDKLYRKINLSKEKKDLFAKKLQSCFKEEMKDFKSVAQVTDSLAKVQDKCTVALIMGKEAQVDILGPVVEGMLEDQNVSEEIIAKTKGGIISAMKARVTDRLKSESLSLDQVVDEFKKVQGTASYFVADATVDKYVRDMVKDEAKSKVLSLSLRKKLFDGDRGYRNQLLKAKGPAELKVVINNLTKDAAVDLTEAVTREEITKLKEEGIVKSQERVDEIAKDARNFMKNCLDAFSDIGTFTDHVQKCVLTTKTEVTYDVFDNQLHTILFESEYAHLISEEEKKSLLKKFLNKDFKDNIAKAYEIGSLANLKDNFVLDATSAIASKVIGGSISDIVLKGKGADHPKYQEKLQLVKDISTAAISSLDECLVIQKIALKDSKKAIDTNTCINKSRLKATELVFEDILGNFTGYFEFSNKKKALLVKEQSNALKKCAQVNGLNIKGAKFADDLNSCLIESIFDYVRNSVEHVTANSSNIDDIKNIDLVAYDRCIEDSKRELVKDLKNQGVASIQRTALYSKIDKGVEFWNQLFSGKHASSSSVHVQKAIKVVEICALTKVVPLAIDSLLTQNTLSTKMSLNRSEINFANDLIGKLKSFSSESFKTGLWIDLTAKASATSASAKPSEKVSSGSTAVKEVEEESIDSYLNKFLPMVGDYLKKIHAYDPTGAKIAMNSLIADIQKALKKKEKLTLDDLKDILMQSDLIDVVIMSEIASFIKKEAKAPLTKEGVPLSVINILSSKKILGPIFSTSNPRGKKALEDIKKGFVRPLLDGKKLKGIPKNLIKEVKIVLSNDTKVGGFVETIAGSIVQNKLDDKRPGNIASKGVAGLMGYNHRDFDWKNLRRRTQSGVSKKNQPVQKAIDYFGSSVLRPILLNQKLGTYTKYGFFSNKKIDIMEERKEKFAEKVEELMELDRK